MSEQQSTIHYERTSPQIAKITFANPPVNLIVGETVLRLIEIVTELATDPDIQVVLFDSATPDFFYNHFDLAAAADFPAPEDPDAVPAWTNLVLELSKAPYITIAVIRGRTRGGGNELALALDLRYASREKAIFGQPEVGSGLLPGGGGSERLPRAIGRDRALEAILTSDDYDADTAERWGWITRALPDSELDAFVGTVAARLASFDRASLASAKAQINRATLPPDGDLVAAYGEFAHSLTLPGFLTRAAGTQAVVEQAGIDFEYRLGHYIGIANQQS
ncbi:MULTISPECIES: enoyl-CoA hydratase/isomerase family protein [Streptomyces]|uniref:Enoyl-CoA hydratase/carnithine racemase n=1 Tax=Streptomyces puniciscabiei TaxID=164348 RepID=A0A542SYF9_9ACTN|nr:MULTISPECIES: enoyl-CoA hydratase/isomerase family protein [Streptomyces]KUO07333.1 enoyl-CoA hydratase [Streptomyces sp. DSM 15324]MCD7444696.1 enoyl-CoA hydratase/isomerase family protein [Streptomyces lincolnensis]TQK79660.1 enoyl-CoA hydratase/carnithine racemase [Streptomyces puniciscabiei]